METERAKRLANFVSWVGANIKGDEKGEAQVFLDRFFQAFGHTRADAIARAVKARKWVASVKIESAQRIARSQCSNFRLFGCMQWDWLSATDVLTSWSPTASAIA